MRLRIEARQEKPIGSWIEIVLSSENIESFLKAKAFLQSAGSHCTDINYLIIIIMLAIYRYSCIAHKTGILKLRSKHSVWCTSSATPGMHRTVSGAIFVLLVLCIDMVKEERYNAGICLLDRSILQPTESRGEEKGLAALGSPAPGCCLQVLTSVLCTLHFKCNTAQDSRNGSNPLQ